MAGTIPKQLPRSREPPIWRARCRTRLTLKRGQPGVQYVVAHIAPAPITLVFEPRIRPIGTVTESSTYLRALADPVVGLNRQLRDRVSGTRRIRGKSCGACIFRVAPIIRHVFGRAFMMIAIRIRSDRLRACSFSIMCARCNSTVRKLMPR